MTTSTRGLVDGLASPFPIGLQLPALFHGDEFAQRFTGALDAVLAPALSALDCFDAYLDPRVAPADFVSWLAQWVGLLVDENWPLARQRALVSETVRLYSWRGTRRGIAELVGLYVGSEPSTTVAVTDSGAVGVSATPNAPIPGSTEGPVVRVRVAVADPASLDHGRLDAIVAAAKPAHVRHEVEVVAA